MCSDVEIMVIQANTGIARDKRKHRNTLYIIARSMVKHKGSLGAQLNTGKVRNTFKHMDCLEKSSTQVVRKTAEHRIYQEHGGEFLLLLP